MVGAIVRRAISAGEPIVAGKIFKRDSPGFLAGSLAAGKRAATIAVDATSGISGFVFPGDYVDILLTHDNVRDAFKNDVKTLIDDETAAPPFIVRFVSEVILKNLRVLAIDQKVDDFETQAQLAKHITLEVTIKQAERLATAKSMGKLSLVLRSLEPDSDESDEPLFTTDVEVSPLLSNIKEVLKKTAASAS